VSNDTGNGNGDERRSLLGEFSAAHKKEFEIPYDRDFDQTIKSQMDMEKERQFEQNNLEQRKEAELDNLDHKHENIPSYGLSHDSSTELNDRYEDIMTRYEADQYMQDVKYSNIRDNIREDGETLIGEFEAQVEEPVWENETAVVDFEQLGIDTTYEFNNASDADYYGDSVGYDYNEYTDPFTDDYDSHYEGDFTVDDDGNDNGNDGNNGGRSM